MAWEEFVENFNESDSGSEVGGDGDDSEERERDYGDDADDNADEDDLFGDFSDDDDAAGGGLSPDELEWRRIAAAYAESIPVEEMLDFDALDDEEMNLPFSYLVPPIRQWEYALDACKSGFSVVGNLGKVSNAVLKLVADGAAMAVHDGTERVLEVNNAIISYAEQRGIFYSTGFSN
jgi:hypothetical protein